MTTIKRAAGAIYRMINRLEVEQELIADSASFFANTESPVPPELFNAWFHQLGQSLHQQPEVLEVAHKYIYLEQLNLFKNKLLTREVIKWAKVIQGKTRHLQAKIYTS